MVPVSHHRLTDMNPFPSFASVFLHRRSITAFKDRLSSFSGGNIQMCVNTSCLKNSEMRKQKLFLDTTFRGTATYFLTSLHDQASQRSCLYLLTLSFLSFESLTLIILAFTSHHYIKTYFAKVVNDFIVYDCA